MRTHEIIALELAQAKREMHGINMVNVASMDIEQHAKLSVRAMEVQAKITALEEEARQWVSNRAKEILAKNQDPTPTKREKAN